VVTTSSAHDIINLVSGQEASKTIGAPVDVDVNAVIADVMCAVSCAHQGACSVVVYKLWFVVILCEN